MPSERVQRRIDRLLDQAEEALENAEWTLAAERAKAVLAVDADNEDAGTFLEMAQTNLGSPSQSAGLQGASSTTAVEFAPLKPAEFTTLDDQPTSFASGRYTVSKFLGEGGKKKVYLAHDNTLDRDVAFALIKTEGLDETSRERVRREAQAMGRMGTHPCIMPIYDLGDESGQPFMVQPLMGGGDVEGLIEDAEGPLELDRAIEIATQTAQGLSFAHSKGIVHRDLKPGNVWLDEDGAAKIGDFGLAVATDRSRLTVEKVMVGTVSYMPPEQATGGEVTPRADLYSLGAMLYEMCTGRVPFMGDDDIGIISQHINTPPVAPSWHNNQIPKTLDALIIRLLAKDPSERPDSADEVLAALDAVDLTAVEEREEESKGSLDAMAGGVFVGRHREMDQLKSIFEDVLSGRGRMVTLVGEPGIGKTRTAQELATYAGMRGAEVLWGRSYESGGAPPYWPWVQAIRSHVAATAPQELRDQLGATAPEIAEVVSDVKVKLPDIPAPTPIEDPESARFRLFDSISNFLKNASSSTPLVLMLEDLHWADKPSLMLLEFVARELANSKLMIVGNYRDMELNRRHPLSVTLGDLSRERLFERVVLRGLQKHDVHRFIEIAAGIAPPSALVDAVHSQTEGNPLFVTETVRLLIQEGDIASGQSSKGGTTSWEIRIPEGVREVIGRRLDRLSERCNEVLTIAAVVGRQFRFDVLKTLAEDTTDGQLLDAMDEALSARIIEELPDEVGFYQFTHAQMQETLMGELSHTRAVRTHAQIAEALEEYYGNDAEEHAAELVQHFAEAETVLGTEKLVQYSLAAGETAASISAHEDAIIQFQRALAAQTAASNDFQRRARSHELLGRSVLALGGRVSFGVQNLIDAFDLYRNADDLPAALRCGRLQSRPMGGEMQATTLAKRVLAVAPTDSLEAAAATAVIGWSAGMLNADFETASENYRQALKVAEAHDDDELRLYVLMLRADSATFGTRWSESVDASLSAVNFAAKLGNQWIEAQSRVIASRSLITLGRIAEGLDQAASGVKIATRHRFLHDLESCHVYATSCHFAGGNFPQARKSIQRSKELGRSRRSDSQAADLASVTGDFDEARRSLDAMQGPVASSSVVTDTFRMFSSAMLARTSDNRNLARELSDSILAYRSDPPEGLQFGTPFFRSVADAALAICAITTADRKLSLHLYPVLKDQSGTFLMYTVSADRILALLSQLSEDPLTAQDHFESALVFCRASDHKPELTWTCSDYSEFLLDRNAPGDREKAVELQDEAISIATELGMKPLLERVLAKREILKA